MTNVTSITRQQKKIKLATNLGCKPRKLSKAKAVNKANREYEVLNLPSMPI